MNFSFGGFLSHFWLSGASSLRLSSTCIAMRFNIELVFSASKIILHETVSVVLMSVNPSLGHGALMLFLFFGPTCTISTPSSKPV